MHVNIRLFAYLVGGRLAATARETGTSNHVWEAMRLQAGVAAG
jgi:hypothetical protein